MSPLDFLSTVARLTPDGDCLTCGKDGGDSARPVRTATCARHEPYDMPSDDAWETLNRLIREAREVMSKK